MLSYLEEETMVKKEQKTEIPYCVKCDEEMQEVLLPSYEYEEGLPLHNVGAFRCNTCGKIFFNEVQAKEMEVRTHDLHTHAFGFERKLTISGKSLVVTIPHEIVQHLHMKPGQLVKLFPLAEKGFLVKKR